MRARCPKCGRLVGANVPKGGDGSAVRLRSHVVDDGTLCNGKRVVDAAEVVTSPAEVCRNCEHGNHADCNNAYPGGPGCRCCMVPDEVVTPPRERGDA